MEDAKRAYDVMNTAWKLAKPYLMDEEMDDYKWDKFIREGQVEWMEYSKQDRKLCNLFSSFMIALQEYKGRCDRRL